MVGSLNRSPLENAVGCKGVGNTGWDMKSSGISMAWRNRTEKAVWGGGSVSLATMGSPIMVLGEPLRSKRE